MNNTTEIRQGFIIVCNLVFGAHQPIFKEEVNNVWVQMFFDDIDTANQYIIECVDEFNEDVSDDDPQNYEDYSAVPASYHNGIIEYQFDGMTYTMKDTDEDSTFKK